MLLVFRIYIKKKKQLTENTAHQCEAPRWVQQLQIEFCKKIAKSLQWAYQELRRHYGL